MARIVIIGGHGKVALRLARRLHAHGDTVSAVIRNPEHAADVAATGAEPVVADIERLDRAGLAAVLRNHDAVVWSAGAGGGDPTRTYAVDRDAAIRSYGAAADAGVTRYVMVSYFGAGPEHGVPADHSFFPYAEAKSAADAALAETDLDFTILRPSRLNDEPGTGLIETSAGGAERGPDSEVSRDDVAVVAATALAEPGTIGRTIEFNRGAVPIELALRT